METNIFLILVLLIIMPYFFIDILIEKKERYFVKKDTPPIAFDVEKVFEKSSDENLQTPLYNINFKYAEDGVNFNRDIIIKIRR